MNLHVTVHVLLAHTHTYCVTKDLVSLGNKFCKTPKVTRLCLQTRMVPWRLEWDRDGGGVIEALREATCISTCRE